MKKRILELDVLRGLSILGMILVITPGNWSHRFEWMNHAAWHGYPLSDMIFPSFLFCVGFSMAISFHKKEKYNNTKLFAKVIKRTILLFLLGLLVNGFPFYNFQNIRIPGVLQRIALCYFIVASVWLLLKYKKVIRVALWLIILSIFILIGYYILLYHIPVSGIGVTGDNSYNSWPVIIDQYIFGVHHLWEYGTTNGKVTYDPEGLLATFPASVNVILGLIIGVFYTRNKNQYTTRLLFVLGAFLLLLGFSLDYFNVMPAIKKIWTSSFVLLSSGFSILLLAFIRFLLTKYLVTKKILYPFIVYGANAIVAFMLSNMLIPVFDMLIAKELSIRMFGYEFFKYFILNPKWSSFAFTCSFLIVLFLFLNLLYKKRIFLKI